MTSRPDHQHNNFNLIRFFLASVVVFTHCFPLADGANDKFPYGDTSREWLYTLTGGQLFGGSLAVYLFFSLSGFLITQSFLNSKSIWVYLSKRALRIYPAFIVTVLIGSLFIAPQTIGFKLFFHNFKVGDFLKSLILLQQPKIPSTFLHNPYPGESNGSLWTIKYEGVMYLLIAVLGASRILKRKILMAFFLVICYLFFAYQIYFPDSFLDKDFAPFGELIHYPIFLSYFFTGVIFSLYQNVIPFRLSFFLISLFLLILGITLNLRLVYPLLCTYSIIYLGRKTNHLLRFTVRNDLSYGIYLNSFLIQQSLLYSYPRLLYESPYALFGVSYPLSLVAGYLSWTLIEDRILDLKRKL